MIDLDTTPAPELHNRTKRPWWAVPLILAAVAVATLDGGPPPAMDLVADLPPGTMRLAGAGDAFYVLRGNGTLAWNVTAYAWSDGSERWRRPLAGPDPDLVVAPDAAVLVTHQPCDPQYAPSVDRLDPATGRPLWTAPGVLHAAGTGNLLLARGGVCDAVRRMRSLSALDPGTGRPRWTVEFPDARPVMVGPDWFAALAEDGAVETFTLAGGTRLAAGTVTETSVLLAAGGTLVAADRPDPGRPGRLTGLPHGTLRPAWSVPLDGSATPCGPWLCVTATADRISAVDPATGRTRWTRPALRRPITGPSYVVGDGVRILRWRDGDERTLPGWRLLPAVDGSTGPVVQRGTTIGVVDLTLGRRGVLGTLPGPQTRCLAHGLSLVCVDTAGRTRLWRSPGA